ncbi:phosphotriesterase-related protein [Microbacterium sp. Gd 4-13]|uniref:phosphotriesterase family protein n=1 Tax=Microbacterium sp. Gd 4-13 TaxID=2173179 RepID=UPI000D57DF98|nr:phosphotriesterase [Microbacterium sp. Gd 4-13]PVW02184.1 phosphotriesterase-related protein [Microbacterium sp. Gd 4-13]
MIRTVTGDIHSNDLGFTYSHEHLLGAPPVHKRVDEDLVILDPAMAKVEAQAALDVGVRSLYEASAWDYSRQPEDLRRISEETGLQIIACGGFNKGEWFDDLLADHSIEQLQAQIVADVTTGMNGTTVRAGAIKYGTSYNRVTPAEDRVLRAAARAHRQTGAVLHGHTETGTMAITQLDMLEEEGVDLNRVGIVHLMRNPDPYVHKQIAKRGTYLCYDGFAKIKYFPESTRIHVILDVVEAGYADRILIGGDLARRTDLTAYTGGPGLHYIAGAWLPRFRDELAQRHYSQADIDELVRLFFVENPKRYFTFGEPY